MLFSFSWSRGAGNGRVGYVNLFGSVAQVTVGCAMFVLLES